MTERPDTPLDALTLAIHHSLYPDHNGPGCCGWWEVDRAEAVDLLEALDGIGWHLGADVHLPTSAPRGDKAAESIGDLSDRHHGVWRALTLWGAMTDEALADGYAGSWQRLYWPSQSAASIRSRRAELVRAGHVIGTGERRPTRNGGTAQVWAAVEASVRAA